GGLGVRLVPHDRLRLPGERVAEHLVHARYRDDLEPSFDTVRGLDEILGVLFRDQHRLDPPAQRREQLLLEAVDRPHATAQRDLTGHRHVAARGKLWWFAGKGWNRGKGETRTCTDPIAAAAGIDDQSGGMGTNSATYHCSPGAASV